MSLCTPGAKLSKSPTFSSVCGGNSLVTFSACQRTPQHHWQWRRISRTMRRPGEDAHVSQLSRSCRKTWRKRIMEGLCRLVTCSASGSWQGTVQGGEDSVPSYVSLDWITQNGYIWAATSDIFQILFSSSKQFLGPYLTS